MSEYRRAYIPGGTFFFTAVTYNRTPLFSQPKNVTLLRQAVATVKSQMPFKFLGAVILPDHFHFIWSLPPNDTNYSKRLGQIKILFTRSLRGERSLPHNVSKSRHKRRESDVWHRRFWEHAILDEEDFAKHLEYIHYNPVKHGLVSCPHFWPYSSFSLWVQKGVYTDDWGCVCNGGMPKIPDLSNIARKVGE